MCVETNKQKELTLSKAFLRAFCFCFKNLLFPSVDVNFNSLKQEFTLFEEIGLPSVKILGFLFTI